MAKVFIGIFISLLGIYFMKLGYFGGLVIVAMGLYLIWSRDELQK